MADQRFFSSVGPFTLEQIADLSGATLSDPSAGSAVIKDVAPLDKAESQHVSFLDNKKYTEMFKETRAGACFVKSDLAGFAPKGTVCLISDNPYMSYAKTAQAFYPTPQAQGIRAETATIDSTAIIGQDADIGAGVVVGKYARIGARCRILPNAVIGDGVEIGDDTEIGGNANLSHCLIGKRVKIYAGVCIGQSGFGFAIDKTGFVTVPQLGRVIVEDDVEIGANATIDRGAGPDTVIGQGTRIDNLVQIGHNVRIGKNCVIVAQAGVAGSAELGDFVMMGGQVGIAGHLKIASGTRIAGQSGVMRNVDKPEEIMGSPAVPIKQFMRQIASLTRLANDKNKAVKKGDKA